MSKTHFNKLDIGLCIVLIVLFGTSLYFSNVNANQLNRIEQKQSDTLTKVDHSKQQLNNVESELNINYKNDMPTSKVQTTVTKFFKIMRTYDSSKTYNQRRKAIEKLGIASINVTESSLFKTDQQETGEAYIDNSQMSSDFESAKLFGEKVHNGILTGKVLVKYTVTTKNATSKQAVSLYDVQIDMPANQITSVQYDYGLNGVITND